MFWELRSFFIIVLILKPHGSGDVHIFCEYTYFLQVTIRFWLFWWFIKTTDSIMTRICYWTFFIAIKWFFQIYIVFFLFLSCPCQNLIFVITNELPLCIQISKNTGTLYSYIKFLTFLTTWSTWRGLIKYLSGFFLFPLNYMSKHCLYFAALQVSNNEKTSWEKQKEIFL